MGRTSPPSLPAGIQRADVDTLFARARTDWDAAVELFERRSTDPTLDLLGFLRWAVIHLPLPPTHWYTLASERPRPSAHAASRAPLTFAECVTALSSLALSAPPEADPLWAIDAVMGELGRGLAHDPAHDLSPLHAVVAARLGTKTWTRAQARWWWLVTWVVLGAELAPAERADAAGLCAAFVVGGWRGGFRGLAHAPSLRVGLDPRDLGRALVGPDGWRGCLEAEMAECPDWRLESVLEVFAARPLASSAALLAARLPAGALTDVYVDTGHALVAFAARPEPAAELLAVAASVGSHPLAELLRLTALAQLAAAGEAPPAEALAGLRLADHSRTARARYREVLPLLPAAARRALAGRPSGVLALAPEDDDAPLRALLEREDADPMLLGMLGGRAVRLILARLDAPCAAPHRTTLETALLEAIAAHLADGGAYDEAWALYLVLANLDTDAGRAVFRWLPEPTRSALLVEAVTDNPHILNPLLIAFEGGIAPSHEDAFIAAVRRRTPIAIPYALPGKLAVLAQAADQGEPARLASLRAEAAALPGPHEPFYVLQVVDEASAPPATSLTCLGGAPPVPAAARPRGQRHVCTIDLRDAPALATRFPGARAASLFVPEFADDDTDLDYGDACWRGWTAAQVAAALGSVGKRRRTLRVFEIVVPAAVFAPDVELDLAHTTFVDRLLSGWSGWLLGRPRTIQADTAATPDPTFVAQLFEEFDLMLGDAGALYSYVDGAVWDCH